MGDSPHLAQEPKGLGSEAAQISRLVVQVFIEITGRGPERVRTAVGEDAIHVVLRDQLTKTDLGLVAAGHGDLVLATRRAVQDAASTRLIEGVEAITGRVVEAFLSSNHLSPDVSVESFILEALPKRRPAAAATS